MDPAIIYQDSDLIAVSKDSGEPVIPTGGGPRDACLHRRLEAQVGARLWVVHRLDREASGLVVFARSAEAHRALSMAFEHREVEKHYVAFALGALQAGSGDLDVALHDARRGKTRPAEPGEPGAREAVTHYVVRRRWRRGAHDVWLVNLRPLTGRRHQIRVHLRAAGAPILFDPLYGRALPGETFEGAPCSRLALHARRLVLKGLLLEAPLAPDLVALGRWLNASWSVEPLSS
jgi:RluA family pseudouridine synthase